MRNIWKELVRTEVPSSETFKTKDTKGESENSREHKSAECREIDSPSRPNFLREYLTEKITLKTLQLKIKCYRYIYVVFINIIEP